MPFPHDDVERPDCPEVTAESAVSPVTALTVKVVVDMTVVPVSRGEGEGVAATDDAMLCLM